MKKLSIYKKTIFSIVLLAIIVAVAINVLFQDRDQEVAYELSDMKNTIDMLGQYYKKNKKFYTAQTDECVDSDVPTCLGENYYDRLRLNIVFMATNKLELSKRWLECFVPIIDKNSIAFRKDSNKFANELCNKLWENDKIKKLMNKIEY